MPHFGVNEYFREQFGTITLFHQQLVNSMQSLKILFSVDLEKGLQTYVAMHRHN